MALDDLDLEFEDEEEAKKKKNDAVTQDVDLEFHSQESEVKPRPARPGAPQPVAAARPPQAQGQVRKIEDARAAAAGQPARRPQPQASGTARPAGEHTSPNMRNPNAVSGANALKSQPVMEGHFDLENQEIVELRERARKAEFDADVKVQVAEFKTELLSELIGDMKLMDHQINQLLVRINAKHPEMKQEVLMIKKILADFTSKKRK
jgi:hypothetical protein